MRVASCRTRAASAAVVTVPKGGHHQHDNCLAVNRGMVGPDASAFGCEFCATFAPAMALKIDSVREAIPFRLERKATEYMSKVRHLSGET